MFRVSLLAIAAIWSSAALAGPVAGTATLAAPAEAASVTGEGGVWRCTGTSCTGPANTVTSIAVAACTVVADKAGRVTAFTAGDTSFGEAELTRCNRHKK